MTERATAAHLPQSPALAETIRRRRVGGAAQKTFAGLVGLELRPRRMRDAANLWAALENAGGQTLRDGRWSHPDLAPTSEDLDDIIGFVERAAGQAGADKPVEGLPESTLGAEDLGTDLDSVLRGILDEAAAGEAGSSPDNDDDDEDDDEDDGRK